MLSTLARGGGGGGGGVIVRMARRGVGFVNVGGSRGNMFSTLLEGMTTAGEKEEYTQIRESVRALCADFPGEYWRELDKVEEYPTEFVKAMTDSGFLSVLIPEEYGGSGLGLKAATVVLEEVHRSGCNAGAAHAQMYTMGSILHSGSDEQKERYLPDIAAGNQTAGVRRVRAEQRYRHPFLGDESGAGCERGLAHQRFKNVDQPSGAFGPDASPRAHGGRDGAPWKTADHVLGGHAGPARDGDQAGEDDDEPQLHGGVF